MMGRIARRAAAALVVAMLLVGALPALAAEAECHVRYVSIDNIYLDAGSAAGLDVGVKVRIVRAGKAVAELEVAYVAENSASCRIISGAGAINTGDRAVYEPIGVTAAAAPDSLVSRARATTPTATKTRAKVNDRFDGWVSVQWDGSSESTDRDLRTDLLSLPFRVRARELGNGFEFSGRGNFRRITRSGFGESTPATEWRNRIMEAALLREGRDLNWQLAFGRVGSRNTAAAGPFDGLSVTRRLGKGTTFGAFGGFAPAWGDLDFNTDDHLVGLVFDHERTGAVGRRLDLTLALVGRYRQSEISREYLSLVTSWRDGKRLSLLQAAEVDLYRGWRREDTGKSAGLTSTALTGRLQLAKPLAVTLGYDGREPVRTWETRSLPDSLFTDAGRNGWRAGAAWRGPGGTALDVSSGIRHEQRSGEDVTSWQAMLRLPARVLHFADLSLSARGFDGPWMSGTAPSARLTRLTGGVRWSLDGGRFTYTGKQADATRDNTWAELGASCDLGTAWSLTGSWHRDWGDDIKGQRLFVELGTRF